MRPDDNARTELDPEQFSAIVVDAAFHLHRDLGPGLLESVYQVLLARVLERRGLRVELQKPVIFDYDGLRFEGGLRVDLLVNGKLVVELKSVEKLAPVHAKQVLTYLRLLGLPLGLLINFGAATFREGCKRIVNGPQAVALSQLRVNRQSPPADVGSRQVGCLISHEDTKTRRHEGGDRPLASKRDIPKWAMDCAVRRAKDTDEEEATSCSKPKIRVTKLSVVSG